LLTVRASGKQSARKNCPLPRQHIDHGQVILLRAHLALA
jgi:hypothetical protein